MSSSQDSGDESDAPTEVFDSSMDNDDIDSEDESLGLNLDYNTSR